MVCPRGCTVPGDLGITGACACALRWSPATCCAAALASHVEPCAENDIAIFHISLWSSVFLVMATCYGGCMLTYMDTGDDSIFNIDISDAVKKAN